MKYMTGKAKMMVTGIALGTVAAGGMAALIAAGKVGVAGSLVVVFLMALAGVSGWMRWYKEKKCTLNRAA